MILEKAAIVFNKKGYFAASMADIMAATGLEKGGIYNHFSNKEELAVESFDFAVHRVRLAFAEALRRNRNAIDRLNAIIEIFRRFPDGFPVPGGCPVMNTAIEADNAHPVLRERARTVMKEWYTFVRKVIEHGVKKRELHGTIDSEQLASILIASLEGAVMLSSLYGEASHMDRTIEHLHSYIREYASEGGSA